MAQRVFWNWKDDDKTIDLIRWLTGMIPNGVYNGFEFSPTADLNFTFIHTATGYKYTKPDYTDSDFIGTLMTRQGAIITEDESITFPIDENTDDHDRIDTIYLSYLYEEVEGGTPGVYSYVKGTPSATPTAPVVPNSNTDLIIGYLFVPRHTSTLNASGVTFTKNKVPNFGWVPNTYNAVNYVHNGDTPHEAIAYLDAALQILYTKYETNTLTTNISVSGEENFYAKFVSVDMLAVGDFFSAIIAVTGGKKLNVNQEPWFGIFEIRVKQAGAFGTNPTVYIKKLNGNMNGNFIVGDIIDNVSPSTTEFHIFNGGFFDNNFSIRMVSVNKSAGTTITYFNNQPWVNLSGTLRFPVVKKMFIRGVNVTWPLQFAPGTVYFIPISVTPNDGKKRTFACPVYMKANFGSNFGYQYMPEIHAYYTSGGSIVEIDFTFGAVPWPNNGSTPDSQTNMSQTNNILFEDVDPGTTFYVRIQPSTSCVSGQAFINNCIEIDKDEFDLF